MRCTANLGSWHVYQQRSIIPRYSDFHLFDNVNPFVLLLQSLHVFPSFPFGNFSHFAYFGSFVSAVLVVHSFSICKKDMHYFTAYLHRGWEPQIHEVTCGRSPHLSYKLDKINLRDYMDSRVTPPYLLTSHTWRPPPPC